MSLSTNKRLITAKIESSYGTDATPVGADAMLVKNLEVNPLQADLVSRDLIRPYYGISEQLLASKAVGISFEVELAGAGTVGLAPAWAPLLKACGFAETISTTSISIAVASGTATVTKTSHGLAVGDKVIISGCTDTALNGSQTILTVPTANTFTYATLASDDPTADGTPLMRTQAAYAPISASFDSVSIYFNVDGLLHKALGCRGNVEYNLAVKQIPVLKFSFTGLYSAPSDTAAATPDFSGFKTPYLANTQNTPSFSLFSYSALLESASLNVSNDVQQVTLIGSEQVKIVDRKPAGQLVFEAPTIAGKDYFTAVANNTLGALALNHGPSNGHKVNLSCPNVSIGNPTYQDFNGVMMLQVPFTAVPTSSGNDEISIVVK